MGFRMSNSLMNVEFDPKRNLLGGLPSFEQVKRTLKACKTHKP